MLRASIEGTWGWVRPSKVRGRLLASEAQSLPHSHILHYKQAKLRKDLQHSIIQIWIMLIRLLWVFLDDINLPWCVAGFYWRYLRLNCFHCWSGLQGLEAAYWPPKHNPSLPHSHILHYKQAKLRKDLQHSVIEIWNEIRCW